MNGSELPLLSPRISVIIAARNNAATVAGCIQSLQSAPPGEIEIIVVDGDSDDGTIRVASRFPEVKIIIGPALRGGQFNAGAHLARGEVLLFLQPATRLETGWHLDVHAFHASNAVAGVFRPRYRDPSLSCRLLGRFAGCRMRLRHFPFGIHGLMIRRRAYAESGGFREWPHLEDLEFLRRMKRRGALFVGDHFSELTPEPAENAGLFRRGLFNIGVALLHAAGLPLSRLANLYSSRETRLCVIARFPGPGMSKARLTSEIGAPSASHIHKALLVHQYRAATATERPVYLYHPREHQSYWFHELLSPDVRCRLQATGDKGRRLECMFRDMIGSGHPAVALIADAPGLNARLVGKAVKALDQYDAVIGPCPGRGVYLLGLKWLAPGLFDRIAWDQDGTLEEIRARLKRFNYRTLELPKLYDIESASDVQRATSDPAVDESLKSALVAARSTR